MQRKKKSEIFFHSFVFFFRCSQALKTICEIFLAKIFVNFFFILFTMKEFFEGGRKDAGEGESAKSINCNIVFISEENKKYF